jgi:CheY-like chemotaxis protein
MNNVVQLARYKKVLLIDDDELDIYIARRVITSALFAAEIVLKTSVDDALKYLHSLLLKPGSLPEIIFLDLNMPGADGFDFLDALKVLSVQTKIDIRVVILTSVVSSYKGGTEISRNYPIVEAILEKPLTPKALERI